MSDEAPDTTATAPDAPAPPADVPAPTPDTPAPPTDVTPPTDMTPAPVPPTDVTPAPVPPAPAPEPAPAPPPAPVPPAPAPEPAPAPPPAPAPAPAPLPPAPAPKPFARPTPGRIVRYVMGDGETVRPAFVVSVVENSRKVSLTVFVNGRADEGLLEHRERNEHGAVPVCIHRTAEFSDVDDGFDWPDSETTTTREPHTWHWPEIG